MGIAFDKKSGFEKIGVQLNIRTTRLFQENLFNEYMEELNGTKLD